MCFILEVDIITKKMPNKDETLSDSRQLNRIVTVQVCVLFVFVYDTLINICVVSE